MYFCIYFMCITVMTLWRNKGIIIIIIIINSHKPNLVELFSLARVTDTSIFNFPGRNVKVDTGQLNVGQRLASTVVILIK